MRLFVTSDLHIDYKVNRDWLSQLSDQDYQEDALVVAGDLADSRDLIAQGFQLMKKKFHTVCFVPGNHDLWVWREEEKDSLKKFHWLLDLAREEGIQTSLVEWHNWILLPLFSWFDFTFGQPEQRLFREWVDFRACQWPESLDNQKMAAFFHALNPDTVPKKDKTLLTFSHFVPSSAFLPPIPIADYLQPVMGSVGLHKQILHLNPSFHIFGHFHMNRSKTVDGITYINNALGYPKETFLKRKLLEIKARN
jgi:Icc-related predicted phosphoesterase